MVDKLMAGKFALDEKGSTTGGGKTMLDIVLLFELMLFGMFPLGFVVETGLPILKKKKIVLEPVCCKKRQKKVHDQLLVWRIGDL